MDLSKIINGSIIKDNKGNIYKILDNIINFIYIVEYTDNYKSISESYNKYSTSSTTDFYKKVIKKKNHRFSRF